MIKKHALTLLNNVKFLYFVFFLAILNLGYFVYNKDNESIFLFIVLCLVVYLFNNNMIIVLLFSMIVINVIILINLINKEGFEEETVKEKEKVKEKVKENEKVKEKDKVVDMNESGELFNKNKLEETKYPDTSDESIKKKMEKLAPLSKMLDGLNITEVNNMINKLNSVIDKF